MLVRYSCLNNNSVLSEVEVMAIFQEATTTIAVFLIFSKPAFYYIKSKQILLNYI